MNEFFPLKVAKTFFPSSGRTKFLLQKELEKDWKEINVLIWVCDNISEVKKRKFLKNNFFPKWSSVKF